MPAFSGEIAVVTGASSGVGKAIALALAAEGATVCIVGRDRDRLESTAVEARARGAEAVPHQADLTADDELHELVCRVRDELGGVDVLVHAAGVIALDKFDEASLADFDYQHRTNARAPYALTQALLPVLRERRGQVVFMNSTAGLSVGAGAGQYGATKHALKGIADSVRAEANADGVRVLSLFLGRTATPMQAEVHRAEGRAYRPDLLIQPDDVAAILTCTLALPRTAEVTDIRMRPLTKT